MLVRAAVAAVLTAVVTLPATAAPRPRLALVDDQPVAVVGSGFGAGERVTVRVAPLGAEAFAKTVTAGQRGRFTATFRRGLSGCAGYTITARGSAGSHGTLRNLIAAPGCGPPITP